MLTDEQTQAINTRDTSVGLSAGAGCGKTTVLTERFLSHLDPDRSDNRRAPLHELVAITFTDAAARGMRDRIRENCRQRLRRGAADQPATDEWLRLLRAIDTARISTIHSFCASLLREHAADVGVDPTFEVLEQNDADVLLGDTIDDVLRAELAGEHDETMELAATYQVESVKKQIRIISQVDDASCDTFLAESPQQLLDRWRRFAVREVPQSAARLVASSPQAALFRRLLMLAEVEKPEFAQTRISLLELLEGLGTASQPAADLQAVRELAKVKGICDKRYWSDESAYQRYQHAGKSLRDLIDKNLPPAPAGPLALDAARLGLTVLSLTRRVVQAYRQRKQSLGKLDFGDLTSRVHKLLTAPSAGSLRKRLADGLSLLLVDEFQDTDQRQVELVQALCDGDLCGGKLFFVGDKKQSIYRFRGAQPDVFDALLDKMHSRGQLALTGNFRSQPAIIDFVNGLFHESFDRYQPLVARRPQVTSGPCVEFLWTIVPQKARFNAGSTAFARQAEARRIAKRLSDVLADGELLVTDESDRAGHAVARPVVPGDIAILFRALSDVHYYEEALQSCDLDYYLVGGKAFYAQQEIYDLLNLLRSITSTCDDVALAGVLRSPFFGLSDESLFWLVSAAGSLREAVRRSVLPKELDDVESDRVRHAHATLAALRQLKDQVPITTLLNEALRRTGYDAVLLAEFLGERKLSNLQKLLEQARSADRGGVQDLDGFVNQLSEFTSQQPDEALAATCPETENVIRLMTIHQAKGLEFPLVVLTDMDRQSNSQQPAAVFHEELGPLVSTGSNRGTKQVIGKDLYRVVDRAAEQEESRRLLYVACTRAADHLILSTSMADVNEPKGEWLQELEQHFDLASGKMIAARPAGITPPHVVVHSAKDELSQPVGRKSRGPDVLQRLSNARAQAGANPVPLPATVAAIPPDETSRRPISVSRLTGQISIADEGVATETGDESPHPFSSSPTAVDPLGLGTLVHAVLERVRFAGDNSVGLWCRELAGRHAPWHVDEAAERATDMIERMLRSPRAAQLGSAAAVHREVEFMLAWPPGATGTDRSGSHVHGFIDCLYQDARGGWRILDYKTNQLNGDGVATAARRYTTQLGVYALAVEQALGVAPEELVLCFLQPGLEHVLTWDAATREEVIELVNRAVSGNGD